MSDRKIGACEKYGAVRIDIWEKPLGPMPGFPHRIPRCVVNIRLPHDGSMLGYVSNEGFLAMAQEQKDRVLSFGKQYNAMAFHFWTETQMTERDEEGNLKYLHEPATAIVDYAPAGLWEEAVSAKIGDYTNHSFKVIANLTKEDDDA